jgi:hypothetical protein
MTGMAMMSYKGIMTLLNRNRVLHRLMDLITMNPFHHMFLLLFLLNLYPYCACYYYINIALYFYLVDDG